MNTDFNKLIRNIIPYAFVIFCAYIIASILFFYLPKSGVDFVEKSSSSLEYRNYNGFYSNIQISKKVETKAIEKNILIPTLSKYTLKGIYSTSSNSGWIIIENKSNKKSHFLSQYEELDSYILTKLFKKHVVFEKSAKEYKLELEQNNKNIKYEITRTRNNINESVEVNNDIVKVKRNYLNSYIQDLDKVWNNMSIKEIKKSGKIDGFKVLSINLNSIFGKLGLKKNDIIKSINNSVLNSYADAFKIYNNINNTKYLNIEILRNNEIMELNYEID